MTISLLKNKGISFVFIIISFIIFLLSRFFVLQEGISIGLSFLLTVLFGVASGLIYILVDMHKIHRLEKTIVQKSSYLDNYACNVFNELTTPLIVIKKSGKCTVYLSQSNFFLANYNYDIGMYVSKLKDRCKKLTILDMLIIYLYKYHMEFVISLMTFLQLEICFRMLISKSNGDLTLLVLLPFSFYYLTYRIEDICETYLKRIMHKRKLVYFIDKNTR